MKISVQVIVHPDDDTEVSPVIREVLTLDHGDLAPDTLGLQLAEAKDLLAAVQDTVAGQQVAAAIAKQAACPHCGVPRRHKDTRTIVVRSLSGALRLASPRWWHCDCRDQPARTFQSLAGLLPEQTTWSWPACRPASPPCSWSATTWYGTAWPGRARRWACRGTARPSAHRPCCPGAGRGTERPGRLTPPDQDKGLFQMTTEFDYIIIGSGAAGLKSCLPTEPVRPPPGAGSRVRARGQ